MEASLPSTELEYQALVVTVPIDYKETVSLQSSFSHFLQINAPLFEAKNSLYGSIASLYDGMEIQEDSSSVR